MPLFEVTAPDGKSFEVNVPEGGTEQDAIAYIADTYQPQLSAGPKDEGGSLVDLPVGFAKGAVQGVRFIADAFGADNPASQTLKGAEEYLGKLMSAQSQKDAEKISQILAEAEDKGMLDQVLSGIKALSVAPVDMVVQAFGTSAPMLVGGLLGAGVRTAALIGGGMGAGVTKDAIYQATKDELIKSGLSKDESEKRAQLAQEYGGENLDQILLGTGLGTISGFTGIEKALLPSAIKNIKDKAVRKSAIANAGNVAIGEAVPEFLQGGQEQLAQNIALQREGFDTPTMRGVLGQATLEGLVGGTLGAGVGAIAPRGTEQQPFIPPTPPTPSPPEAPVEDPLAVQQFVDQRYPAPPTVAPPTPPAPVSLADARLQKQQQASRQFGLGAPALDASQAAQTGAQAPVMPPLDTTIPFPKIQAPPSGLTQESFATPEEARIQKQQQAQAQFGLDRPIGAPVSEQAIEPITAPVSPSQVPVRQPRNLTAQDRQTASLRVEQLGRQLDQATTDFDRQNIRAQIDQALGVVEPTQETRFVDLQPMDIRQATSRLNVLRGEIADAGDNALNLNVVPHPSVQDAFAIEQRPVDFDLDLPSTPVSAREAQQRIEANAMAGQLAQRGGEEEARQVIVTRALQSIQDRGGVASPAEAQIVREANLGQPYDRIDPSLAPQGTVDQRLTSATGIDLVGQPKSTTRPELREQQNAEMAAEQDRRRQLEGAQRATAEQAALEQSNQPPAAPDVDTTVNALKVAPAMRSATQVATVNQARTRMAPEDFGLIQMEAQSPANLTLSGRNRLNEMRQGTKFSLSDNFSPDVQSSVADIKRQLLPALKRLGLNNVGLKLVDSINNGDANGFYLKQIITIALDSENPMGVMRHEVIHALKELGAFTDAEWKALTKRAQSEWIDRFLGKDLVQRYKDVYAEQNDGDMSGFDEYIQEEAIAEAFRYFTEQKPPAGLIQNIMTRLNKMFDAIKTFFSGKGLTPEDIFLTNAIFGSIESGRLTPGRGVAAGRQAPAFSLNSKIQQAAQEVGLTEQELNATSLPLQTGDVGKERFKTPKTGLLTNTIKYLEDRRIDSGVPVLDIMKDEDHPLIAKLITAEAMAAIRTGGSALDWYDGVITRTINMAVLKHPELATDKNAGTAFKLAMAITSQGLNVEDNIKLADQVYNSYKTSKKFPLIGSGGSAPVMKKSFKFANKLIDKMGMDEFSDFLGRSYSVRDLESEIGKKISGELKDEMVLGSAVFGPKIGLGFYSNLNGNFEPVTMDMWFMRMIGRLTGKLRSFDEKKVATQIERLRAALKETGTNGIYAKQFDKDLVKKAASNLDSAFELAKLVNSAHERDFKKNRTLYDSKQRVKSELVSSAGTILKSLNKPIDSPSSGGQRRKLRQIFAQVRNNVAQLYGKDIQPAALQALVWYPEQSLYESLGVKLRVTNQDYAGAMRNLLLREGFNEERIVAAAQRGSGSIQPTDLGDVRRRDGSGSRKVVETVQPKKFSLRSGEPAVRPSRGSDEKLRDGRGRDESRSLAPLAGAPISQGATGPDKSLVNVAEEYARKNNIPFGRQAEYVDVDPLFAQRIAQAYENMPNDPRNPEVKESYEDLIRQVAAQYQSLVDNGYEFTFFDSNSDPYSGNPYNAMRDLRNNQRMAVYGTYDGYGDAAITDDIVLDQPMLADTGLRWPDQNGVPRKVLANDLFRVVHDAFGHGLEGAGFRARGEENAFQAHAKLFTGKALGALASETRGQNSWLNYGRFGKENQNAKVEDTIFAEQKIGLMPSWTWTERIVNDAPRYSLANIKRAYKPAGIESQGVSFNPVQPDAQAYTGSHYGKQRVDVLLKEKYGTGLKGAESRRLDVAEDPRIKNRVYFYIPKSDGTMPPIESGLGGNVYSQKLNNILPPGQKMRGLTRLANNDSNLFESYVIDAGYDGYAVPDYGMMVVLNQDVPVKYEGTVAELTSGTPRETAEARYSLRAPTTPEFKRFFKDSKVVDADGKPLLMYHATTNFQGNEFKPSETVNRTGNPDGYYFTYDVEDANRYAGLGEGAEIIPVFLSIKNPYKYGQNVVPSKSMIDQFEKEMNRSFDLDRLGKDWYAEKLRIFKEGRFPNISFPTDAKKRVIQAGGYDGMKDGRDYVAFEPNQIKSAFNQKPTDSRDIRFSLRAPSTPQFKQWFGNSKIVNPDGSPKVMYHGTARDITEFRPKQAGAIFVTDNPEFAESFADASEEYMKENAKEFVTPEIEKKLRKEAKSYAKKYGTDETDVYNELVQEILPSRANIMPVFIRVEKPFDYENPAHIEELKQTAPPNMSYGSSDFRNTFLNIRDGSWATIESKPIQKLIRDAGFDGFYVLEGGEKNLAVYSPNQVKSATGNVGTFSKDSDDIRYNLSQAPNAPPQVLTKTTPKVSAGKAIVNTALETMSDMKDNTYWETKRINWVDRYSGLTNELKQLPIFQTDGVLRADMIKHAQANVINTVKTGIVSGVPFVAADGTIAIRRTEDNLARSEFLADSLSLNKNVVDAGMTGKNYVAEVARALRGDDILKEDAARNKLGVQQLQQAKDLYLEIKRLNAQGGDMKLVKGYLRMIANLRKEGYKNKKMNRELQVTPEQIKWAKEQLTKVPEVQGILDIWKSVNNSLIDLWEETGLLKPDDAAEYRNNQNYVPLFKAREDLEDTITRYGAGLKSPATVKQLKGSLAVRNIWENIDKQYASMTVAAYENQSRRIAFEQLESLGGATETAFKTDDRINLRFKRDGRDVNAIVDNPNVLVAFQTFSKELTPAMKFMGFGTQVLRAGALINPMFWIKQLIRDPIHATLTSNSGIVTPLHAGAEFFNVLIKNSKEAEFLASRGVIGQIDSTVSLNDFLKNVGRDRASNPNIVQKALHKLLEIHESSDAATRVAVFKKAKQKALKDGMSEDAAIEFAVYKAREVINFGVSGAHPFLNSARQMIPFLNATIVGLDSLYKAATGYGLSKEERAEAMRVFRTNASVFFIMSLSYALMMQDDEDYKKLPDYVKDNNFLIPMGFGAGKTFIKLPIPYEVGFLFKTVPEVMVRYASGTSTGKEVVASYLGGLLHNLPTGGVPIPQAVRPALEVVTNFSFFTMRPIEGMSDTFKPVEMRGDRASAFAKVLSGMGLSKLSLSPKQIDYLSRGYFAELGTFTTEMADYAIYAGRGETPPPKNLEQQPFFRSFMTNREASKAVSDFYEISGTAQQTVNGFNALKESGSEEEISKFISNEKKAMTVAAAPTLRKIGGKMSELKKAMQQIKDSDMPSDEKLRLHNEMYSVFKSLAEQGVDVANQLGIR